MVNLFILSASLLLAVGLTFNLTLRRYETKEENKLHVYADWLLGVALITVEYVAYNVLKADPTITTFSPWAPMLCVIPVGMLLAAAREKLKDFSSSVDVLSTEETHEAL